jgi:hypothetical protein
VRGVEFIALRFDIKLTFAILSVNIAILRQRLKVSSGADGVMFLKA